MFYRWAFPDYSLVTVKKHNHFPKLWLFISAVIITHPGKQECKRKESCWFLGVCEGFQRQFGIWQMENKNSGFMFCQLQISKTTNMQENMFKNEKQSNYSQITSEKYSNVLG